MVGRHAALRGLLVPEGLLGVADGSAQAVQAEVLEVLARPGVDLLRAKVPALPLYAEGSKPSHDVAVDLDEVLRGVPGAEVATPSAQQRVEIGDDVAKVRVASRPRGELFHALPNALQRAPR